MHTTLRVDLTKQTSQWNRIQVASALALFFSLDSVASTVFDVVKDVYDGGADHNGLFIQVPTVLLALFMIRQTWNHGSIFSRNSLRKLRYAFVIGAAAMSLLCAFTIGVLLFLASVGELPKAQSKQLIVGAVGSGFLFIGCIVIAIAITRLTGSEVGEIGLKVNELLDDATAKVNAPQPEAYALVRLDQPMGLVLILVGALVFILGAALGSVLWDFWVSKMNTEGNPSQILQLSTLVEIGGAVLVLKGRAYFTPKAEAVLAIDKRTPIVYLRSFSDETPDTVHWSSNSSFVDRSLEMKLARYFLPFGPFLAVGSPRDAVPKLGALRLIRSDAEWQGEVMGLMDRAQLLLASVGSSRWIKWELGESLRRGLESKSLFIFPVNIRYGWRVKKKQAAQQAERINTLTALYGPTQMPNYQILT